jgi:hypothetical protein
MMKDPQGSPSLPADGLALTELDMSGPLEHWRPSGVSLTSGHSGEPGTGAALADCAIAAGANTRASAMHNAANSNTFLTVPPPVAFP